MSFVTKQQCLKQPDTHFVISGYQDNATKEAVGTCLCPIGKKFDYENTKTCRVPSDEPEIAKRWPLPINNYSLETECRQGFESISVNDVKACLATKCPSDEAMVKVNGIPRCVMKGAKNDITYGYLQTSPCMRISAPLELTDKDEIRLRNYGGYYTFFPGKCSNVPPPLPMVGNTPEIWPISYSDTKSPIVQEEPKPESSSQVMGWPWEENDVMILVIGAVAFLVFLWLIVLYRWIRS